MSLSPKTVINHYEIISMLGKGGMGEVYLAQDSKLDRKVAIKFLSEVFSEDAEKLGRFIQEAKAASALNHPNILTVYEIGEFENSNYIVTENIDGRTLSDLLRDEIPDIHKTLNVAIQITSALAAAHDAGIVHRDIKSSNVMIRKDGIAKLLDFGLAKLTFQESAGGNNSEAETIAKVVTVPGMLMGTPTYMSPEQARGKQIDSRTDIFSFGILFFEMLTGKRPFVGESYADIMGAILKDEAPPLGNYLENVSPGLEHILEKTLRKDRSKRYQNTKDLVIDLKDLRDELKFEAKLIHSTGTTKSNLIHKTGGVDQTGDFSDAPTTIQVRDETTFIQKLSPSYMLGALLLLGLAGGGLWWWTSNNGVQTNASQPTSYKKTEVVSWNSAPGELSSSGEFSPDGKMIAYSNATSGSRDIWIKQTDSGESIQVTKDSFDNENPFWSPSGSEIAFFSERSGETEGGESTTGIWRIPILGGTPKLITAVKDASAQLRSWSKSGKIYYESGNNLFAADVSTGETKQITKFLKKEPKAQSFSVSEDERSLAFARKLEKEWEIVISPISGENPTRIGKPEKSFGNIVWHPDNKRILYSSRKDNTYQIFVANRDDTEPIQITSTERDSKVVDISPDGKMILIGSAKEESNLWRIKTDASEETAIASSIDSELWSSASPDNKRIAFQSIKNLSQGNNLKRGSILVKDLESEGQALKVIEKGFLPVWSPDGNKIAFSRAEEGKSQIWLVEESGGKEQMLTSGGIPLVRYSVSPYNRTESSEFDWSPDSKSIAYISDRNGFSNVWLVGADGSGDVQITDNKDENLRMYCPLWSASGEKIAYYTQTRKRNADGKSMRGIWMVTTQSKEANKVSEMSSWVRLIGWSGSDQGLVIAEPSKFGGLPPEVVLSEINVEAGTKRAIATLKESYFYNVHISPDRQQIAYVSHEDGKDNILLIGLNGNRVSKITNNNDPNLYFSSLSWSPDGKAIFFGKQTRYSLLSLINNFD